MEETVLLGWMSYVYRINRHLVDHQIFLKKNLNRTRVQRIKSEAIVPCSIPANEDQSMDQLTLIRHWSNTLFAEA